MRNIFNEFYHDARFLAFYLPQYYPIPENNSWYGKGFTDWNTVIRAKKRFPKHIQPKFPADLGFYDLRVQEVRKQQASLAKKHGIYGFVYHHYWFKGQRLLNRPLDDMIASGKPDFPFCLSWANESWSRKCGPTYGSILKNYHTGDVLIEQSYSKKDYIDHIKWLIRVFTDPRYIKVGSRPLVIVYRPSLLSNPTELTSIWKETMRKHGLPEPYICMIEAFKDDRTSPAKWGFDASIEFQPDNRKREQIAHIKNKQNDFFYSYVKTAELSLQYPRPAYKCYPCIMPAWDNTARRQEGATIYIGSTPKAYGEWVYRQLKQYTPYSPDENFIFVNSWNEWAEGSMLEPDAYWRSGYLQEHSKAIKRFMKEKYGSDEI